MSEDKLISIVDDDELARDGIRELVEVFRTHGRCFSSAEDFLASSLVEETACLITDAAKAIGVEVPAALVARADKLIE